MLEVQSRGPRERGRGFRFGNLCPGGKRRLPEASSPAVGTRERERQPGASWWMLAATCQGREPRGGSRNAGLPWGGGHRPGARISHPQAGTAGQEVGRALLKPCRRRSVGLALPTLALGARVWLPVPDILLRSHRGVWPTCLGRVSHLALPSLGGAFPLPRWCSPSSLHLGLGPQPCPPVHRGGPPSLTRPAPPAAAEATLPVTCTV